VTLFGWILAAEIFVVSETRVVVWEVILKEKTLLVYRTQYNQVASTPSNNGTQAEVYRTQAEVYL
jgi:hypothetical protein